MISSFTRHQAEPNLAATTFKIERNLKAHARKLLFHLTASEFGNTLRVGGVGAWV